MTKDLIEKHSSPDGLLSLFVRQANNDICIGFEGFPWHTRTECLPGGQTDGAAAVRTFVEDVIGSRMVLCILRICGQVRNVWPVNDLQSALNEPYRHDDEEMEFRYWDGTKAA